MHLRFRTALTFMISCTSPTISIADSVDLNLSKLQEILKDGGAWDAAVQRVTKSQTQLSD